MEITEKNIPGVYNYCDRWCERCPFTTRCAVFKEIAREDWLDAAASGAAPPACDIRSAGPAAGPAVEEDRDAEDPGDALPPRSGPAWLNVLAEVPEPTEAELAEFTRQHEAQRERTDADPACVNAKEYAGIVWRTGQPIEEMVRRLEDVRGLRAIETIRHFGLFIASKVHRAIHETLDPEYDASDLRSDSNGTAKVCRLAIAESREAWMALAEPGRAVADGLPEQMVRRLDQLEATLAARFPHSMEFIRSGIDE